MPDMILVSSLLSSFAVRTKNVGEHLSYHLTLVSLGYDQLVKSESLWIKEKN